MYEKSANYMRSDGSPFQFMLLCEVALGEQFVITDEDNDETVDKLPTDKNSLKAQGAQGPDHSKNIILPNGVQVPISPVIQYADEQSDVTLVKNFGNFRGVRRAYRSSIEHNEYIVFDESQVRIRYLIQIKA